MAARTYPSRRAVGSEAARGRQRHVHARQVDHVGEQHAEEREAAQHVDELDALFGGDGLERRLFELRQ
jgi:hypothetical protein